MALFLMSHLHIFFHFYRTTMPGKEYNFSCCYVNHSTVSTTLHVREEISVIYFMSYIIFMVWFMVFNTTFN